MVSPLLPTQHEYTVNMPVMASGISGFGSLSLPAARDRIIATAWGEVKRSTGVAGLLIIPQQLTLAVAEDLLLALGSASVCNFCGAFFVRPTLLWDLLCLILFYQSYDILHTPECRRAPGRHRRGHPQCFMTPHEIVLDRIEGEGMPRMLQLFGAGIREPGIPPYRQPGCKGMPLHIRGGNVGIDRAPHHGLLLHPAPRGWTLPLLWVVSLARELDPHGRVAIGPKSAFYGLHRGFVASGRELYTVGTSAV